MRLATEVVSNLVSVPEVPLPSLQIAIPLLLVSANPSVFADQVVFKNGDRLTGAIVKSEAKSLMMTTAVAGDVTVSWKEIQQLRSDLRLRGKHGAGRQNDHQP